VEFQARCFAALQYQLGFGLPETFHRYAKIFGCDFVGDRADICKLAILKLDYGRPKCPGCGAYLILALPPGGKGRRTFQCFDCDGPDPLKADRATGWLKSELQAPK
jgi:hypothetical protein